MAAGGCRAHHLAGDAGTGAVWQRAARADPVRGLDLPLQPGLAHRAHRQRLDAQFLFWINLAVLLLILGGTAYKISALSGGGDAVAHMLDGQPIFYDDPDPACRRLLNVVDEMALAAGVPAPQVYLLPEAGINAFAAGFEPSDTVVGVTAGALEHLNREQLQGVIAHEFSHILSGDMRLNVRMAGVLHGIMLLGLIGRGLSHSDNQESWEVRRPSIRSAQ